MDIFQKFRQGIVAIVVAPLSRLETTERKSSRLIIEERLMSVS
jgi:hypothetical protein